MANYGKLALGALAGIVADGAIALVAEFAGGKPVVKQAGTVQEGGQQKEPQEIEEEYANADFTVNLDGIKTGSIHAGASVHDPSIIKIGDEYYIYGSHMSAAKSKDLKTWTSIVDGYGAQNPVYGDFMMKEHVFDYAGNMFSAIPNSFTVDEDGNDILVYHARKEKEITGDPLYNPNRHAMLMKIKWDKENRPVF